MATFRKTILLATAASLAVSGCVTAPKLQGSIDEIRLAPGQTTIKKSLGDSVYYEAGTISLPLAKEFATERRDALRKLADQQYIGQSSASLVTLGTLLSALGLSLAGAGSPELFTILGLSGATATGGTRLFINEAKQGLLEDGAKALNCLIYASEPYFVKRNEAQEIFGDLEDGPPRQPAEWEIQRRVYEAGPAGLSFAQAHEEIAALPQVRPSLAARYSNALAGAASAKADLDQKLDLATNADAKARANKALQRSVAAIAEAEQNNARLLGYMAGVEQAGPALHNHVQNIITTLRQEIGAREANPQRAREAFSNISQSLADFFASTTAGDALTQGLAGLSGGGTEEGDPNAGGTSEDENGQTPTLPLDDEISALNKAVDTLNKLSLRTQEILAKFDARVEQAGKASNCPRPSLETTLIVTPQAAVISLAAGEEKPITITAGVKPTVAETNDAASVLTVTGPDLASGTTDQYIVKIKAADSVSKASTATIEIRLDKTGRIQRKTINIAASPPPTVSISESKVTIERGKSKDITVTTSDGKEPLLLTDDDSKEPAKESLTYKVKVKNADKKEFTLTITIPEGAEDEEILLKVTTADKRDSAKLNVIVPKKKEDEAIASATSGEKPPSASVVALAQKVLNQTLNLTDNKALTPTGTLNKATKAKLMEFQKTQGLPQNGELTSATLKKIRDNLFLQAATQAAWSRENFTKNQVMVIEKALCEDKRFSSIAPAIKTDGTLQTIERKAIFSIQSHMVINKKLGADEVSLNGGLDSATIAYILKNTAK